MRDATPKTVRFWTWENDGWVRLALRDGQTLKFSTGGATDEGYHCESSWWWREGETVHRSYRSNDRDCDGPHEFASRGHCSIFALASRDMSEEQPDAPENVGILAPEWERGEVRVRDVYAEMAGY
jgi:hypothetical protein